MTAYCVISDYHDTCDQFINGPFDSAEAARIWAKNTARNIVKEEGTGNSVTSYEEGITITDRIGEVTHEFSVTELIKPY